MPIIIPANSAVSGGFDVDNSCRFNHAGDDRMDRTVESPTLGTKWTFSTWVKKDNNGDYHHILTTTANPGNWDTIRFSNGDTLQILLKDAATNLTTTQLFRDNSAFYSIIVAFDSTQGTASSRLKLYINGTQITSFSTATYPTQNLIPNYQVSGKTLRIGANTWSIGTGNEKLGGVICETVFIDGVAHAPTDFGEFDSDSNIWKPIDVSGLTFGNNGFYLDYQDSSALGNDVSGNNNDFSTSGLTAVDQSTDTCTNNFATWNALFRKGTATPAFSNGNLTSNFDDGGANEFALTTFGVTTGKWYAEVKWVSAHGNGATATGILDMAYTGTADPNNAVTNVFGYFGNGNKNVSGSASSYGASYGAGDIISLLINCDDNELIFQKNGTSQASGAAIDIIAGVTYGIFTSDYGSKVAELNTGSPPYAISSGNQDADGFGNFKYAVPSGYFSLNTKNLAEYG